VSCASPSVRHTVYQQKIEQKRDKLTDDAKDFIVKANQMLNSKGKVDIKRVRNLLEKSQSLLGVTVDDGKELKNLNGEICHNNTNGCMFNTSSNRKIFIIGDSHMGSLMFDLKDRLVKNNYQFITSTNGGCIFYPGFNLTDNKTKKISDECNDSYFQKLKYNLSKEKDSIIIFGGRYPLNLSNYLFDNQD
jgi:hypothetical protein